ncbi:flagellar hook-length control protein FliK [Alicyclobacillus sp. TC]|uniref:flagellar hook-length control protein FliK n=1 Tax=Alicyclobacillus sp. TC TaxID=2606450 RepID=UPI0019319B68|nr:flagellar hook-length control protein FliK [Alicyclobacillus sp. TC]QRF23718.1 flagellar hook-length control protein FliK [Alicyclobacillus sp. TC]
MMMSHMNALFQQGTSESQLSAEKIKSNESSQSHRLSQISFHHLLGNGMEKLDANNSLSRKAKGHLRQKGNANDLHGQSTRVAKHASSSVQQEPVSASVPFSVPVQTQRMLNKNSFHRAHRAVTEQIHANGKKPKDFFAMSEEPLTLLSSLVKKVKHLSVRSDILLTAQKFSSVAVSRTSYLADGKISVEGSNKDKKTAVPESLWNQTVNADESSSAQKPLIKRGILQQSSMEAESAKAIVTNLSRTDVRLTLSRSIRHRQRLLKVNQSTGLSNSAKNVSRNRGKSSISTLSFKKLLVKTASPSSQQNLWIEPTSAQITKMSLDPFSGSTSGQLQFHLQHPDAVQMMNQFIVLGKQKNLQQLTVQVHPEGLGSISIQVQKTDAGIQIQMLASQSATLQWLQSKISELQTSLQGSGIQLSGLAVGLQNGQSFTGGQQSSGRPFSRSSKSVPSAELAVSSTATRWSIGQRGSHEAQISRIDIKV